MKVIQIKGAAFVTTEIQMIEVTGKRLSVLLRHRDGALEFEFESERAANDQLLSAINGIEWPVN